MKNVKLVDGLIFQSGNSCAFVYLFARFSNSSTSLHAKVHKLSSYNKICYNAYSFSRSFDCRPELIRNMTVQIFYSVNYLVELISRIKPVIMGVWKKFIISPPIRQKTKVPFIPFQETINGVVDLSTFLLIANALNILILIFFYSEV